MLLVLQLLLANYLVVIIITQAVALVVVLEIMKGMDLQELAAEVVLVGFLVHLQFHLHHLQIIL